MSKRILTRGEFTRVQTSAAQSTWSQTASARPRAGSLYLLFTISSSSVTPVSSARSFMRFRKATTLSAPSEYEIPLRCPPEISTPGQPLSAHCRRKLLSDLASSSWDAFWTTPCGMVMPPPSVTAGVRPYFLSSGHWLAGKKSKPLAPNRTAWRHISSMGMPRPKLRVKQDCFNLPFRGITASSGVCPVASPAKANDPRKFRRFTVASYFDRSKKCERRARRGRGSSRPRPQSIAPDAASSSACQTLDVLHGAAKTFDCHAEPSNRVDGDHPPVGIERNHVGEHAAKCKRLRRFAECIYKRILPAASAAHAFKYAVEPRIRFLQARQHRPGSSILPRSFIEQRRAPACQRRGPRFLGLYHPVKQLAQILIRAIPRKNFHLARQRAIKLFIAQRLRQFEKTPRVPGLLSRENIKEIHRSNGSFRVIVTGMVMNPIRCVQVSVSCPHAAIKAR